MEEMAFNLALKLAPGLSCRDTPCKEYTLSQGMRVGE